MGGTKSGSTDGARRGGRTSSSPVEERRSREDISIGHELFCETSLSFPLLSSLHLCLVPFPPTEEHCHCGSGAKGKSVSLSVLYLPSASSPLFLSDFQYLSGFFSSAASSKCLQITRLWNSTLHFALYVYLDKCPVVKVFCSAADKHFSFSFFVFWEFFSSQGW